MSLELFWHDYKYYPYEYELGFKEIENILKPKAIIKNKQSVFVDTKLSHNHAEKLVYFSKIKENGVVYSTIQANLEKTNGNGKNRQSTRYSVHGIHEYKGKFNPQIVRAILNIFNVNKDQFILDPFCGSGTSLVECSHYNISSIGFDINPLAVFIANAKLQALVSNPEVLKKQLNKIIDKFVKNKSLTINHLSDERIEYLKKWFDIDILKQIEYLRTLITATTFRNSHIFMTIASNILRDYSLQDPNDLRIRRRTSELPQIPLIDEFRNKTEQFIIKLDNSQKILKNNLNTGEAFNVDSRKIDSKLIGKIKGKINVVISSPPYATALPYIDTQRLSLIWLNMIPAKQILNLESVLIGSREIRGQLKQQLFQNFVLNRMNVPEIQHKYCLMLNSKLSSIDGFRRQAVPYLLYRYFSDMAETFKSIRHLVKKKVKFALVVGMNHTKLGGERSDIDTPAHLIDIARENKWILEEKIDLQTYQRYGYHMKNSVNSESLIVLRSV